MSSFQNVSQLKDFLSGAAVVVKEALPRLIGNSGDAAQAIIIASLVDASFDGHMTPALIDEISAKKDGGK